MGLADELDSGLRNMYKYNKVYSRATPEIIEDDIFKTIIPLCLIRNNKGNIISSRKTYSIY